MTAASARLRLLRAGLPVSLLWVGKLIIDEVVRLVDVSGLSGADLSHLWTLLAVELALAVASDLLGRATALVDSLLEDLFTNETSEVARLPRACNRITARTDKSAQKPERPKRPRESTLEAQTHQPFPQSPI